MIKKLLAAAFSLLLLVSASTAFAQGPETDKPITFSGYEFGSSFESLQKNTRLFSLDFKYGCFNARVVGDALPEHADRESAIANSTIPTSFFARLSGEAKVAGHNAGVKYWFVYPVRDNALTRNESEAIFYAGEYEFHSWENLVDIHADLKSKLTSLYGQPFYTGDNLSEALGEPPFSESVMQSYNDDNAKYKHGYVVWKSSANNACAVLALYNNGNDLQLKLCYISDCAEEHFNAMEKLGMFSDGSPQSNGSMEGL